MIGEKRKEEEREGKSGREQEKGRAREGGGERVIEERDRQTDRPERAIMF